MVHGKSRKAAWAAALEKAGLPLGQCIEADFSAEAGAAATRLLLDSVHPPTAIAYANDLMAMAGLSVAQSRGISVPGELSITGYDDTEIAAFIVPSLTTVRTDVLEWGRAAATRLLELVESRPGSTFELSPPQLLIRESTGPARPD
jgi:DNA-binding LacI/PurR family transcriptional regulator